MKRLLAVTALALMLVAGGVSGAMAGYVQFYAYDTIDNSGQTPACGQDNAIKLSIFNVSTTQYGLYYSVDGGSYQEIFASGSTWNSGVVDVDVSNVQTLLSFKLSDGTNDYFQGVMNFHDTPVSPCAADYFMTVDVTWDDGSTLAMNLTNVDSCEGIAPVPIPAAAWLLGCGLLGLVGIRRRKSPG